MLHWHYAYASRPSSENGNPNAKEKPIYCFQIPAYAGMTQVAQIAEVSHTIALDQDDHLDLRAN